MPKEDHRKAFQAFSAMAIFFALGTVAIYFWCNSRFKHVVFCGNSNLQAFKL